MADTGVRAGAAMALVILFGSATPSLAAPLQDRVVAGLKQMSAGKCDLPAWRGIVKDRAFRGLKSVLRSLAYVSLAACGEDDQPNLIRQATAEPEAPSLAWAMRFVLSAANKDQEDALKALEAAADRAGDETFNIYDDDTVFRFDAKLAKDPAAKNRFLRALDQANWRPNAKFENPSWIWLDLVTILIAEGDLTGAQRVSNRIYRPEALLRMRLDKRYDPIVAADPSRFDIQFAALFALETERKALSATPDDALGIDMVATDLRILGRSEEALALVDAALARPGPLMKGDVNYRNWILNVRSDALSDLGEFEAAIITQREAAAAKENGSANVSQVINLAGLLRSAGHPDQALATLAPFDTGLKASPYGDMWVAAERVCALYALGKAGEAAKPRAFTIEHASDNRAAVIRAALCANDLDAVATALIGQLSDPETRTDALLRLSHFKQTKSSPFGLELRRRFDSVRDRADIRAAVDKVGRTESIALVGGPMGAGY